MTKDRFASASVEYVAPALTLVGSLEGVTQGNSDGTKTDMAFPTNTPKSELTFS